MTRDERKQTRGRHGISARRNVVELPRVGVKKADAQGTGGGKLDISLTNRESGVITESRPRIDQ